MIKMIAKRITLLLLIVLPSLMVVAQSASQITFDKPVEKLLKKMTLEEKVGQMTQINLGVFGKSRRKRKEANVFELDTVKLRKAILEYKVGSILNYADNKPFSPKEWNSIIGLIQKIASENKLNIPLIYGVDAIRGQNYGTGATMYPVPINQGASLNRELVSKLGEISAYETRACGIPWAFSPVLGVGRDPRWPRLFETFGEDVYLVSEMGVGTIKAYEGDDISNPTKVASCMKHFLGYSVPASGKDRTPAYIPERQLREYFLPSFKKAVDAGAHTVMINSAEVNGIPVHANYNLLTNLLKKELGFEGFAVSDWEDIIYLYSRHHVAASEKEATKIAINAGVDMSMVPVKFTFVNYLIELVNEGEVSMERIDDAVRRILKVKMELGLFKESLTYIEDYPEYGSEASAQLNRQLSEESVTLLKNEDNILPLKKDSKVLLVGPTANSMRALLGGWSYSWSGDIANEKGAEFNTIVEAVEAKIGKENATFIPGVQFTGRRYYQEELPENDFVAIKEKAKEVDYILLCLGENSYVETSGNLTDLAISENQQRLAQLASETGKPVILIMAEGRPRVISAFEEKMNAVLMGYLPGVYGGDAIADILFGDVNPSGKLPITYPKRPNSYTTYDHKYTEGKSGNSSLYKTKWDVQWPFGYGMSYSTFEYSNLKLDKKELGENEVLTISVDVTNTSDRKGKEVVQLFISDLYASITPSVKRLRGFEKISLDAGETKTVTFSVRPRDIAFVNQQNKWMAEKGQFKVLIYQLKENFSLKNSIVFEE